MGDDLSSPFLRSKIGCWWMVLVPRLVARRLQMPKRPIRRNVAEAWGKEGGVGVEGWRERIGVVVTTGVYSSRSRSSQGVPPPPLCFFSSPRRRDCVLSLPSLSHYPSTFSSPFSLTTSTFHCYYHYYYPRWWWLGEV